MMDEVSTEVRLRGYLKRVTAELSQTRQRLREVESAGNEPIAIVGMACRYPGADSPEELWDLVVNGRDAVTEFPRDRGWDLDTIYDPTGRRPGTSYIKQAGFLRDATGFDAEFFGISDDEALAMDPQQRVILETSWEALEHARIAPPSLSGINCGVYIGAAPEDYGPRIGQADADLLNNLLIGTLGSIISGRIAYSLGLTGPAMTMDVGSASSAVAIHVAVRALRAGDCELALTGGVSVFATPKLFIATSGTKKLSPTARAKPFAEASDGNNYAEGAGMLVLERLSEAQRRNHRVLAVIRGTASNQSGARNGLTSTNTPAAADLFRRALTDARLNAADVDLVEGNSHGAPLAAPMEVQALQAVYGQEHSANNPVYLGSMKSNFGHASAASGVGGVIKLVMALRHRVMPKVLHVDKPTSLIDWSAGAVELLTGNRPWTDADGPRRAAVSSFGIGGSNGHVILEEAPTDVAIDPPTVRDTGLTAPVTPWVVSAKSDAALRGQAAKLLTHMESHDEASPVDMGFSLATTRAHYNERAGVIASDRAGIARGLRALRDGEQAGGLVRDTSSERNIAFVFTGQTGAHTASIQQLRHHSPVFATTVDKVARQVDQRLPEIIGSRTPIEDELTREAAAFAIEIALYRMLTAWGLEPEFTVSQSPATRAAAAYAAGAITLTEAHSLLTGPDRQQGQQIRVFSCFNGDETSGAQLNNSGVNTIMELGYRGHAANPIRDLITAKSATFIPLLRNDTDESASVATALVHAHVIGVAVDWNAYYSGSKAQAVELPTYAYQRKRYWINPGAIRLEQSGGRDATRG